MRFTHKDIPLDWKMYKIKLYDISRAKRRSIKLLLGAKSDVFMTHALMPFAILWMHLTCGWFPSFRVHRAAQLFSLAQSPATPCMNLIYLWNEKEVVHRFRYEIIIIKTIHELKTCFSILLVETSLYLDVRVAGIRIGRIGLRWFFHIKDPRREVFRWPGQLGWMVSLGSNKMTGSRLFTELC